MREKGVSDDTASHSLRKKLHETDKHDFGKNVKHF